MDKDELKRVYKMLLKLAVIIVLLVFFLLYINEVFSALSYVFAALSPLVIGVVIAYILNYQMIVVERFLRKARRLKEGKAARIIALIAVYAISIGFITLVILVVTPELSKTIEILVPKIPDYMNAAITQVQGFLAGFGLNAALVEKTIIAWQKPLTDILVQANASSAQILGFVSGVVSGVYNALIGLLLSVYLLIDRDRILAYLNRLLNAAIPKRIKGHTFNVLVKANQVFGSYIATKLITSTILGVLLFVLMTICGWPLPLLCAAIIFVTNLVPMIGPIIGGVISALLVFVVNPAAVIWYVLIIVVLFQIEGNFLTPKFMARKTGMPAIIVLLGVIVGGGFFGVIGMILGPPVLALVYYCIGQFMAMRLNKGEGS